MSQNFSRGGLRPSRGLVRYRYNGDEVPYGFTNGHQQDQFRRDREFREREIREREFRERELFEQRQREQFNNFRSIGLPLGEGRITTLTTKMAISKVTILRITAIITKANSIMVMDFRRKTEKSRKKGRWRNTNVTGSQKMGKIVKSATKPTTGRADRGSST